MEILNSEMENQNAVDLSTQQLVHFPPSSDDTFLYVFYFFHPFLLESLLYVVLFLFPFYAAHVHQLALMNLMLSDQLFENKLIDIYLITTNNTSESPYGHVYKQLPPLMVFAKSANGVRPSLFCIGFIIMKLNTKLIPSFNQNLISESGRS
jgi:hypothetical protein